ncbi:MAG: LCP family protein [Clostridia bacterium]|nr:LCP family protein [Clostridia bacterium]
MVVSLLSVFLRFYSKVDYVPDDPDAYYRGVKAADIQSASYVTNLLLIGTDERTEAFSDKARADCMMLLSFNSRTDTVSLVSLERGMTVSYLKSDGTYGSDLLTHVFRHGGAGLLIHTIENTFKVKIDGYVRVNFHTFAQIIDRLGGVDITLDADEVRGLNTEKHKGQVIDRPLSVGINHLSGEEALLYARLRWIDSDFQRIQRQRKVIVAVKEKLRDVSAFRLMGIAGDILPLVQTNLSASRMASALFKGSMALGSDTQQMTVPFKGTYKKLKAVDFEQNAALLREKLY